MNKIGVNSKRVYEIYDRIFMESGITDLDRSNVIIEGADPVLPTKFLVGELGAASLACIGKLVSELWRLKTNKIQTISIKVKDAALAQKSHQYLKLNNKHLTLWDQISGFYQTKDDRWIQYHCNFQHHKLGVLKLLDIPDDKELVIQATKQMNAFELEATLLNSGMCANVVRTHQEWLNHPQYIATKDLPIIEIKKIASSPPRIFTKTLRPLSDIKVLDLTRVIAGPICGKMLAEHGADVTLINSPNLPNIEALLIDTSYGKKRAFIDLDRKEDKEKLIELITKSDVFIQSYRPGALASKGFGVADLVKYNPNIIYVSLDAYGSKGPWSLFHGYDSLIQSVTGIAGAERNASAPKHLPCQTLDYVTGYLAATGALQAIRKQNEQGGAYHISVSLVKTANFLLSLGLCDPDTSSISIPTDDEISYLMSHANTKLGSLEYMNPVLKMSETSPYYSFLFEEKN